MLLARRRATSGAAEIGRGRGPRPSRRRRARPLAAAAWASLSLSLVSLGLAASACRAERAEPAPAPPALYEIAPLPAPAVEASQRIGRGRPRLLLPGLPTRAQAPRGVALAPLRAPMVWQVPGQPRAVVSGADAGGQVTELWDIDDGVVRWRVAEPSGPVVGVTAEAIVGADRGTWALALDGTTLWQTESPFVAMAGAMVVVAGAQGRATVLDAATGRDVLHLTLPEPLTVSDLRWACPARGEVWAIDSRGTLHRVLAPGAPSSRGEAGRRGVLAWSSELAVTGVEGCAGELFAATTPDAAGRYDVVRLARDSGAVLGRVPGAVAHWVEDPIGVVVSQAASSQVAPGLRRWDPELRSSRPVAQPQLGERLAELDGRRLLRDGGGAALVGESGAVVKLAVSADSAALGERAMVTAISSGASAHGLRRWALAPALAAQRARRELDPSRSAAPALAPAPLFTLEELARARPALGPGAAPPGPLGGTAELGAVVALDDGVLAVLRSAAGSALVRLEAGGRERWRAAGACAGQSAILAGDGELAVCAGRTASGPAPVAAFDARTGAPRWTLPLPADSLQVAGGLVLVRGADRAALVRADGLLITSFASADGAQAHATLLDVGGATLLVSVEGPSIVARWPRAGLAPVWAVTVDGVVRSLAGARSHALVVLTDGEAYTLRGLDGVPAAIAAEAAELHVLGEGVLALTPGATLTSVVAPAGASGTSSGPPRAAAARLALFSLDGAERWAYDIALPGPLAVLASQELGASAVVFGAELDHALELGDQGIGPERVLPESAASAAWVRLRSAPQGSGWVGLSTTTPRAWSL